MCEHFVDDFLLRLMACNAEDGASCGLAGMAEMRTAFKAACSEFHTRFPGGTAAQFEVLFRRACFGEADQPPPPDRPTPPPFSDLGHEPLDVDEVSTVVPLGKLLSLMSSRDKRRFERNHHVRFTASGATLGADLLKDAQKLLVERLAGVPERERKFRIAPDEVHGRPYVWFTPREGLTRALADRRGRGHGPADIARDFLGLVHHGLKARGGIGPNHLVALHIPASVVAKAGYMRPSAVQAFDNQRFIQRFEGHDIGDETCWGNALDLNLFATTRSAAPIGGRERILLRLQASLLEHDETIGFDYLGVVSSVRGDTIGRDDNGAFLDLVRRDRDTGNLVKEMCG